MTPVEKFDRVLTRVRELQECGVRAAQISEDGPHDGPARVGNTRAEYVAEFHLAGKRALQKRWPSRFRLFALHFSGTMPLDDARKIMRLPERTCRFYVAKIKYYVGREVTKRGLYPPSRYHQRVVRD